MEVSVASAKEISDTVVAAAAGARLGASRGVLATGRESLPARLQPPLPSSAPRRDDGSPCRRVSSPARDAAPVLSGGLEDPREGVLLLHRVPPFLLGALSLCCSRHGVALFFRSFRDKVLL